MNRKANLPLMGIILLALFGSALDSQGWAGWAAVAGTLFGITLLLIHGKEGADE